MHNKQSNITITEALLIIFLLIGGISVSIIHLNLVPHIPIALAIIFLFGYGILKKRTIQVLETGLREGAQSGLGAVLLFFFIGMLISSWMASGTIPTLLNIGLNLVSANYFLAIVFIVTAIIGVSIGSSLTTAATIGVAFIGIGEATAIPLPYIAGAVISGAFFGDKMSPLSDTTNLASSIVGVDLFTHIRNMAWTTVPAFIISLVGFAILSPSINEQGFQNINLLQSTLAKSGLISTIGLIPLIVLVILAIKRVSAYINLSASIIVALSISFITQKNWSLEKAMNILFSGYVSNIGEESIDALLSRGGIESMFFSMSLVLLALSMGGILLKLGIIETVLVRLEKSLRKSSILVFSTALTAIGINISVGEQYLSILLTGNTYKNAFNRAGLEPKNLARILEDAGTVVNPLVPWSVCGVFLTSVLGVSTLSYLPFVFFCLLSPVLTILFGMTGWTLSKKHKEKSISI